MNDLIQTIEATIPADWCWLVRRHTEGYFANICEGGVAGAPDWKTFNAYASTPERALRAVLAAYRGTLS